uniref:Uncharacterized protein n=1 Tax=Ditylenchus dipsaci TaxID=166011 RepID=A0A915CWU3_9BILA
MDKLLNSVDLLTLDLEALARRAEDHHGTRVLTLEEGAGIEGWRVDWNEDTLEASTLVGLEVELDEVWDTRLNNETLDESFLERTKRWYGCSQRRNSAGEITGRKRLTG